MVFTTSYLGDSVDVLTFRKNAFSLFAVKFA
jgi:hypothetical protein